MGLGPLCVCDSYALGCNRKKVTMVQGGSMKTCNFPGTTVAIFVMGSKDAPQKIQFVGAIKKVGSLVPWRQNAKWRKTSTESTVTGPK